MGQRTRADGGSPPAIGPPGVWTRKRPAKSARGRRRRPGRQQGRRGPVEGPSPPNQIQDDARRLVRRAIDVTTNGHVVTVKWNSAVVRGANRAVSAGARAAGVTQVIDRLTIALARTTGSSALRGRASRAIRSIVPDLISARRPARSALAARASDLGGHRPIAGGRLRRQARSPAGGEQDDARYRTTPSSSRAKSQNGSIQRVAVSDALLALSRSQRAVVRRRARAAMGVSRGSRSQFENKPADVAKLPAVSTFGWSFVKSRRGMSVSPPRLRRYHGVDRRRIAAVHRLRDQSRRPASYGDVRGIVWFIRLAEPYRRDAGATGRRARPASRRWQHACRHGDRCRSVVRVWVRHRAEQRARAARRPADRDTRIASVRPGSSPVSPAPTARHERKPNGSCGADRSPPRPSP